ncbi:MAG: ATP-binding cassette domain-containing protein [Polyangiales bacterium]
MISISGLTKHYRVHERPPGLGAALRSVFHRKFKLVRAVEDVSFSIAEGERVGFLGPNGAGQTTTLKMLAGLLHPTSGRAVVAGFEPRRREAAFLKSIMLVTGQKQQLLWDLPPAETFELNRAVYEVPMTQYRQTLDELVDLLRLSELIGKPTRQLSLGERMKCELAAALLHRPRVLFLDEPTIGLDVTMQAAVRGFIKAYNERHGATVILTSHYMDDVSALCPRVLVIDHGSLTYDGALDALVRRMRPEKRLTLRFETNVIRASLETWVGECGGKVIAHDDCNAILQAPTGAVNQLVQQALSRFTVVDLKVEDAPLEEVLAELFAQKSRIGQPAGPDAPTESFPPVEETP